MPTETQLLKLYMKSETDKSDTFNVTTMLNENWQKIDANAQVASVAIAEHESEINALGVQVAAGAKMTDSVTGTKYKWGIEDGAIFVEEVN